MLEDETRQSLMIEGYFTDKRQLKSALQTEKRSSNLTSNQQKVIGYFDAAYFGYELAYQQFQENEFSITKPLIRQAHANMFRPDNNFAYEPGEWRRGPIEIGKAKVQTLEWSRVVGAMERLISTINAMRGVHPVTKASIFHAFFEQIHPFPDGNGRVGRILMNFILVAHGMPNVAIKGTATEKDAYFKALEEADPIVFAVLHGKKSWSSLSKAKFISLENLIEKNLAQSMDEIICRRFANQESNRLIPVTEVAKRLHKNPGTFLVACSQRKEICIKISGHLYSHPDLIR